MHRPQGPSQGCSSPLNFELASRGSGRLGQRVS